MRHFFGALVLGAVVLLALIALVPVDRRSGQASMQPVQSYEAALGRLQSFQALDGPDINPECTTVLLSHGRKTERAVVLLHGYTSCPRQFAELGQALYDQGYNVLIPRMPYHGMRNRLTDSVANLTAGDLARYAHETADIAQGLGNRVTVVGLSGGGVLAGLLAAQRADLAHAVLISPVFGLRVVPDWMQGMVSNLGIRLPNQFWWWEPQMQEQAPGPSYAYPRFSTRALAEFLLLGQVVQQAAQAGAPPSAMITLVTNASDRSVSNTLAGSVLAVWRSQGARTAAFEFPLEQNLPHDLIDPRHPQQQVQNVYPRLLELITADP